MNTVIKSKIMHYQNLKGLNNHQLAVASELSPSTLNALFAGNYDPTFDTLSKICNGLGISLSQFFAEDSEPYQLTEWHKELLAAADTLPNEKRAVLLTIIREIK